MVQRLTPKEEISLHKASNTFSLALSKLSGVGSFSPLILRIIGSNCKLSN